MTPGLLLLLASTVAGTIGVRVEHSEGLSSDQSDALAQTVAQVAEVTSNRTAKLDARGAPPCAQKDQCARDVRVRTGATTVLFVSAYGAVSKIALFLELYEEGKPPVEKRIDLEIAERTWRPALVRALSGILPKAPAPPKPVVEKKPPEKPIAERPIAEKNAAANKPAETPAIAAAPVKAQKKSSPPPKAIAPEPATSAETRAGSSSGTTTTILQWSTIGAGTVLAIAGTVLLAGSFSAQSDLDARLEDRNEEGLIDQIDYRKAQDEADSIGTRRTVGLVLGLAGVAAIGGGLVWLLGGSDDRGGLNAAIAPHAGGGGSIVVGGSF